ncbi:MAG: hypothetical protein ACREER_13720 [Alphaproteobacteria bacterium]
MRVRAAIAAWLVAGCAATGAPDSTFEQKFTWYRYLAGDDVRAACAADGPIRFRFVYNAVFTEEVRALDLDAAPGGGGWLESRRYQGSRVLDVASAGPLNVPQRGAVFLNADKVAELLDAITASGFAGAAETGLILRSDSHYAVASGCRGGEFKLHGYAWNTLGGLGYAALLERLDPIGIPWPKPVDTGAPSGAIDDTRAEARESSEVFFVIEMGQTGLRGVNEL